MATLRRYQEQGIDGLCDLSRRPHISPNATHLDGVGKILYLRQNYHFGPGKIAMYLKRYHDVEVSQSGIWRILKRLDLNRLPASQRYKRLDKRWKRYEKQLPGHQVQIDVKFVEPLKTAARPVVGRRTKYYQFTAIDDCTRLRVLRIYPPLRSENRDPVRRLRARATALLRASYPDRQRRRIPISIPLPRPGQRRRSPLHQTPNPAPERQSGEIPPHRR